MTNYELYHHGIKGQKWGVRRYQNSDGTRTAAGKKRRNYIAEGVESIKSKIKRRKEQKNPSHDELIKSTNARVLYKHRNQLSDAELANRLNRINMETNLRKQAGYMSDMTMNSIKKGYSQMVENTIANASKITMTAAIGTTAAKAGIPILAEAVGFKQKTR